MMSQQDLDLHQKLSIAFSTLGTESYKCRRKRSHSSTLEVDSLEAFLTCQEELQHVDDLVGNDLWRKFELAQTSPLPRPQRPLTNCKCTTNSSSGCADNVDQNGHACKVNRHAEAVRGLQKSAPLSPPDSDESGDESENGTELMDEENAIVHSNVFRDCMWSSSKLTLNSVVNQVPVSASRRSPNASSEVGPKRPDGLAGPGKSCADDNGPEPFPFPLNSLNSAYCLPRRKSSTSSTDGEEDVDASVAEYCSFRHSTSGKTPATYTPPRTGCISASVVHHKKNIPGFSLPICSATVNTPPATPSPGTPVSELPTGAAIAPSTPAAAITTSTASMSPRPIGLRPQRLSLQSAPSSPLSPNAAAKRVRRERERVPSITHLSTSIDEDDPEVKRATHNVLERRRREDLKVMYANLRCCLPDLELKDKAAKVKILERANGFIQRLVKEKSNLDDEFKVLQRRNCQLRQQLSSRGRGLKQ